MPAPLPAVGTRIALYGLGDGPGVDHWNDAASLWDGAGVTWASESWQEIACDVTAVSWSWGVDEPMGAVAIPAAGQFTIEVYDPARELDPANDTSPYRAMLAPKTPVRVLSPAGLPLGLGWLDTLEHTVLAKTGRLEAIDGVGFLAGATTTPDFEPFAPGINWSLGAMFAAVLANVSSPLTLGATVPAAGSAGDPLIGPRETKAQNAWQLVRDAAQDALWFVWVDWTGAVQVAEYGYVIDSGTIIGDGGVCPSDLTFARSAAGIVNSVSDALGEISYSTPSLARYGPVTFSIDRIAPGGFGWAQAILADRSAATNVILPIELLPITEADLQRVRDLPGKRVRIRLLERGIDEIGQVVGGTFAAEGGGAWRAGVRVYQPGIVYDYNPPTISNPPPRSSRRIDCDGATHVYVTPTGVHGRQDVDNFHLWVQGATLAGGQPEANRRSRALLNLPIGWTGVRRFVSARLSLYVNAIPSPAPASLVVQRVQGDWTADAVDWPGPSLVSTRVLAFAPNAIGWYQLDVTSLVWPIVPQSLGGYGLPNQGLAIRQYDETVQSTVDMTDFGLAGTGWGPYLDLTVEV